MTSIPSEILLSELEDPVSRNAGPMGRLLLRTTIRELRLRDGPVSEDQARKLMYELGAKYFVVLGEDTGVKTLARIRGVMLEMGLDV